MQRNEFNHYALHYLNLWVSKDRLWCDALAGDNDLEKLQALSKAAAFYRIARNLRTRYDKNEGRYRPVLRAIDKLKPQDFDGEKSLLESVTKVRDKIKAEYGQRDVLSATTKFLWLKIQSPVIIYDSQARKALGIAPDKIDQYYAKWREVFNHREQQVRDACASLHKVHDYTEDPAITTPRYITKIAAEPWFRERVFDVYLWRVGLLLSGLPRKLQGLFQQEKISWNNFISFSHDYQRHCIGWIVGAGQKETQRRRLDILIKYSAANQKLKSRFC